jgi:hypothetical protein
MRKVVLLKIKCHISRKAILLAIVIVGASAPAIYAQTIKGSGNDNCGEWLQLRQAVAMQRATTTQVTILVMEQSWIDGFVSGLNATNLHGVDLLASKPGEGMYAWIDNYCRSKPLDSILDASLSLVKELRSQAGRR